MATAEKQRRLQVRGLAAEQERRALAMEILKLGGKSTTVFMFFGEIVQGHAVS